jgi:hypothetical protein
MDVESSTRGRHENAHNIFVGKLERKRQLENLCVDWRLILNRFLEKQNECLDRIHSCYVLDQ